MLTDRDYLVQMERYEDMHRAADKERLLQQAPRGKARWAGPFVRVLSLLGHRLIDWLRNPKRRYTPAQASTKLPQRRQSGLQLRLSPQWNAYVSQQTNPADSK